MDSAGLVTTYEYLNGGRTTLTVLPGGATNTVERHPDGRTKVSAGEGAAAQHYDYGVNPDGSQWTTVYTGTEGTNSPMWVKTTTDLLGRTIREEKPGFGGVILTETHHYNDKGQVIRTEVQRGWKRLGVWYFNDFHGLFSVPQMQSSSSIACSIITRDIFADMSLRDT